MQLIANKTLKFSNRNITKTVDKVVITEIPLDENVAPVNNSQVEVPKVTSPTSGDTTSPRGAVNGVKSVKAATPKLSAATDPFFLDMDSTLSSSKPVNSGVQSLRERYICEEMEINFTLYTFPGPLGTLYLQ